MDFVEVTDAHGSVVQPQWLARAESVHRQLRDKLPADYARRMAEVFEAGARMTLAVEADAVCSLAVWRIVENTYEGRRLYVDDLVTDGKSRSRGYGERLLQALEHKAREAGCDVLALDSGTQRSGAHRFYFRAGMHIPAFCFRKDLK